VQPTPGKNTPSKIVYAKGYALTGINIDDYIASLFNIIA